MKGKEMTLIDWQKRYGTEEACLQALIQQRWPEGFRCPCCGHDGGYVITTRGYLGMLSMSQTNLGDGWHLVSFSQSAFNQVIKWFWAIYLIASDKGGVSALRLSKQINVSWITAGRMLRKIRIAMQQVSNVNRKRYRSL